MYRALRHLFDCLVTVGNLRIVDAHDRIFVFGDGHGAPVTVSLSDKKLEYELALDPAISLGEAYMDGRLWMESGTIYDLFEIMLVHSEPDRLPLWLKATYRMRQLTKRLQQYNLESRSHRNVAHHYNIDGAIYDLFLDTDRQYSCAYFEHEGQSFEDAQLAKSGIWQRSFASLTARKYSTSAQAGADWVSISRVAPTYRSPESR